MSDDMNEKIRDLLRASLERQLDDLEKKPIKVPLTVGGAIALKILADEYLEAHKDPNDKFTKHVAMASVHLNTAITADAK